MKLSVTQAFSAPPEKVFAALTDPAVLQKSIEGCEKLVPAGEGIFDATVRIGLAGLKGTYTGRVEFKDVKRPESFTLITEGKGPGSFVRGTSKVTLTPKDGGTVLVSEGDVSIGGVLAAVASRFIESAAKKQIADFFAKVAGQLP